MTSEGKNDSKLCFCVCFLCNIFIFPFVLFTYFRWWFPLLLFSITKRFIEKLKKTKIIEYHLFLVTENLRKSRKFRKKKYAPTQIFHMRLEVRANRSN